MNDLACALCGNSGVIIYGPAESKDSFGRVVWHGFTRLPCFHDPVSTKELILELCECSIGKNVLAATI